MPGFQSLELREEGENEGIPNFGYVAFGGGTNRSRAQSAWEEVVVSSQGFTPPAYFNRARNMQVLFSPRVGVTFTVSVVSRIGRRPDQTAVITNAGPVSP